MKHAPVLMQQLVAYGSSQAPFKTDLLPSTSLSVET